MKISFIGGGNMASAIISGLLAKNFPAADIMVVEMDATRRSVLKGEFGVNVSGELTAASPYDVIILAVKPQQLRDVAIFLGSLLSQQLIISIAAGVRCADLARWLGNYSSVIRVMPNTPAQIQAGVSALFAASGVTKAQRQQAEQLMAAVGSCLWVDDEKQMDAVTALSGSGPAYVFYFLEAMQTAGVELVLTAEQSRILATHTFEGAAKLAINSDEELANLRTQVTSKGGTTEKALNSMEVDLIKPLFVKAIRAAAERSAELGELLGKD